MITILLVLWGTCALLLMGSGRRGLGLVLYLAGCWFAYEMDRLAPLCNVWLCN